MGAAERARSLTRSSREGLEVTMTEIRNHDDPRQVKYPTGSAAGDPTHITIGGEQIPALPPGHNWLVQILAPRRPVDRSIVSRFRKPFLAAINVVPMEGVK